MALPRDGIDNPLAQLLWRRARTPQQVALAVLYALSLAGIIAVSRLIGETFGEEATWLLIGVALAELVVCWAAADAVFGDWRRLEKNGVLRELMLTGIDAAEIRRGFFLGGLPVVAGLALLGSVLPLILNQSMVAIFTACALAVGLPVTAALATALASIRVMTLPGPIPRRWFRTLLELGTGLSSVALVGVLLPITFIATSEGGVLLGALFLIGVAVGPGWFLSKLISRRWAPGVSVLRLLVAFIACLLLLEVFLSVVTPNIGSPPQILLYPRMLAEMCIPQPAWVLVVGAICIAVKLLWLRRILAWPTPTIEPSE